MMGMGRPQAATRLGQLRQEQTLEEATKPSLLSYAVIRLIDLCYRFRVNPTKEKLKPKALDK